MTTIHTIDLNFQDVPDAMGVHAILHRHGAVLIDCGPGSTLDQLQAALHRLDLTPRDVTDVLLTHIHFDHAGAAGWWSQQGAQIHVHEIGAPHLTAPEKLLASATRIYGEMMDQLWGEFLAVPADRLHILRGNEPIDIEGLRFVALDTPGHADHHMAYLFEDVCFSGDVGGVRVKPDQYLRLPMPPPEFHIEKWRASIKKLREAKFKRIAPTHFGIYDDAEWQLGAIEQELDQVEAWLERTMPADPPFEELQTQFVAWMTSRDTAYNFAEERLAANDISNPLFMSVMGLQRYWKKYRS
jgi:glyoxylase-like metal-dependent hydrolase (beta-lactamase superfamily II)